MSRVTVVGAGLAGCEAAWHLAHQGIAVTLVEMKPVRYSPAHHSAGFAELICSNSLKAERLASAGGLLKAEMQRFGSLLVDCAYRCRVPAGGALAVDRDAFSDLVTQEILNCPGITVERREVTEIPAGDVILAVGPLASDAISGRIQELCGQALSFYDAAAPIVTAESLDMSRAFTQSRYDRGDADDYINCPMDQAEYEAFYHELIHARTAQLHNFDRGGVYEGCMPIEVMARRGADTMRFGPLKPVGLRDPATGKRPWAVLQLRKENTAGTLYNLVGFQTNLAFPEQQRVFGMIPALKNAQFIRYGVMHRNTFLNAPQVLDADFTLRVDPRIAFAGQITGVEGYMESACSGILAAYHMARRIRGLPPVRFPNTTMCGALSDYISASPAKNFQPMGANFGIIEPLEHQIRDKQQRYTALAERSLETLDHILQEGRA